MTDLSDSIDELSIRVLEGEPNDRLLRRLRGVSEPVDLLPLADPGAWDFFGMLACFHTCGLQGDGVTVAVIDTGFNPGNRLIADATVASHDLLGDGLGDQNGHGTIVSMLLLAAAPAVRLIHVKAFDRTGTLPGESRADREQLLVRAIDIACRTGAKVINISAGLPRFGPDSVPYFRDGHCICDICQAAARAWGDYGATVVAAAGNRASERIYDSYSMCPAAAAAAIPVIALRGRSPIFSPAFPPSFGAPGVIPQRPVSRPARGPLQPLAKLIRNLTGTRDPWGSSFATPLVTGLVCLLRELFRDYADMPGPDRPLLFSGNPPMSNDDEGEDGLFSFLINLGFFLPAFSRGKPWETLGSPDPRTEWLTYHHHLMTLLNAGDRLLIVKNLKFLAARGLYVLSPDLPLGLMLEAVERASAGVGQTASFETAEVAEFIQRVITLAEAYARCVDLNDRAGAALARLQEYREEWAPTFKFFDDYKVPDFSSAGIRWLPAITRAVGAE